jgi:putative membrane protein
MKWPTVLGILIGIGLAVTLFASNDLGEIGHAIAGAGWGLVWVVALRLPQTAASAVAWRDLVSEPGPSLSRYFLLRWIREGVNALLPVAGVGGDLVRARLLALRGVTLKTAAASSGVDLSLEMATQIVFSLIGVAVLVWLQPSVSATGFIVGIIVFGGVVAGSFMVAQRYGLFKVVERLLIRISEREGWEALGDITGLHDAVVAIYHDPRRLWTSAAWHLASWLLGVLEIWAALHILGVDASLQEALVIESLGQAVRGLGFAIPGALGVQEGGFILVCGLFGIPAEQALALSLVRRIRDISHGVPALIVWQRIEGRRFARLAAASPPTKDGP